MRIFLTGGSGKAAGRHVATLLAEPFRPAAVPTSTACGSTTSSSRTSTPRCSGLPRRPVAATTQEIRDRFYDGVEMRRRMGRDETFYSIDKAREMLGYTPEHSWRDVLPDPRAETS